MGLSNQLQAAINEMAAGEGSQEFKNAVKEAARWKGAAYKAAELAQDIEGTQSEKRRLALKISRLTTKGDLDAYLMKKFGMDASDARNVSNHLTHYNIPADKKVDLKDFAREPWAKLVM